MEQMLFTPSDNENQLSSLIPTNSKSKHKEARQTMRRQAEMTRMVKSMVLVLAFAWTCMRPISDCMMSQKGLAGKWIKM